MEMSNDDNDNNDYDTTVENDNTNMVDEEEHEQQDNNNAPRTRSGGVHNDDASMEPPADKEKVENIVAEDDDDPDICIVYSPGGCLPKLSRYVNRLFEVRISSKYLTTKNKEVMHRCIWGNEFYTDDSDIVAILHHMGKIILRPQTPSNYIAIICTFRVLQPLDNYPSSNNYDLESRSLHSSYHKNTIKLVNVQFIDKGTTFNITKPYERTKPIPEGQKKKAIRVVRMTPQLPSKKSSASDKSDRVDRRDSRKRKFSDIIMVYNSLNEPSYKYNLRFISDKGIHEDDWTSSKLKKYIMLLESNNGTRYEISRNRNNNKNDDTYSWSSIDQKMSMVPMLLPSRKQNKGNQTMVDESVYVRPKYTKKTKHKDLSWQDFEWGPSSVRVKGEEISVSNVQYVHV